MGAIGESWEDVEKRLFTEEEIQESDRRVAALSYAIRETRHVRDLKRQEIDREIRRRFGRRRYLVSRYTPQYPMQAEREFGRIGKRYVRSLYRSMKTTLQEGAEVRQDGADYQSDSGGRYRARDAVNRAAEDFQQSLIDSGMDKDVDRVANMTRRHAVTQWEKSVERTLGAKIDKKGYLEKCGAACESWANNSRKALFGLFSGAKDMFGRAVDTAIDFGESIAEAVKRVYEKFLARVGQITQHAIGELNALLSKLLHIDSGVTRYMWKTKRDFRVRECHASFDGHIFQWDSPPEVWYRTGAGIVYTGRRCHPGEDYGCRCTASPIFEIGKLNLQIAL